MENNILMKQSHWIASLKHFLKIKRVFVLSGNINDTVLYETSHSVINMDFSQFLVQFFIDHGYHIVAFCDDFSGFVIPDTSHQKRYTPCNNPIQDVNQFIKLETNPCVLVLRFMTDESHDMFTVLQSALMQLSVKSHQHTMIMCLFEQPKVIPSWLYQNYATVHTIDIGLPTKNDRQTYLSLHCDNFYSSENPLSSSERINCIQKFARLTQGLMLRELNTLQEISKYHQIDIDQYHKLIRQYKFGSQSQSWEIINAQTFERAEKILKERIKGQDEILYAILDTLKRAAIGLSGVSSGTQCNAPRSVMFFAGPTGVGKTEMAKCIAETFLGDQSQLFRLDMN